MQSNFHSIVGVFLASKLRHANKLREWAQNYSDIYITSRWVLLQERDNFKRPESHIWRDIVDDVIRADCVIVYLEEEDRIKGALTQVGVAWAYGKPVYVVGEHRDYEGWRFHTLCRCVPTLAQAFKDASMMHKQVTQIGRGATGDTTCV